MKHQSSSKFASAVSIRSTLLTSILCILMSCRARETATPYVLTLSSATACVRRRFAPPGESADPSTSAFCIAL